MEVTASATKCVLNVRVPAWCTDPVLKVNGQSVAAKPGSYAAIDRTWSSGDVVELTLPMTLAWTRHDHFEKGPAPFALTRGPVVFALDTVWWNDPHPAPQDAGKVLIDPSVLPQTIPTGSRSLGPFYRTSVTLPGGTRASATFVPFANMGRWYRDDAPKPEPKSKAYSYAVWLQDVHAQAVPNTPPVPAR
jgi:hypothetical protein